MITIKDLKFKYSGSNVMALDGINLNFPRGKYIAILGHNGSGKSTLSKVLVGLYKPTSGEVTIDGITLSKKSIKSIRQKIGIVFQNPDNQFVGASVEDDIAFGLENKRLSREVMRERVIKYSQMVNMENHLDKEPQSLSGGQKQRVAIASTLALDPSIIIFDEVTSMLDPKGKREVLSIVKDIKSNHGKTLISITHDMDEAIMADMVIVLANGKVIAAGNPSDILNDEKICKIAKIDAPFIYKVSTELNKNNSKIPLTYNDKELLEAICK